jgi:GNAT superfamily N-acetyltransferase
VSGPGSLRVAPIAAAETRALRQRILRPHQRAEELGYPGDDDPESLHVGAFTHDGLVGIASVFPAASPADDHPVGEPGEGEGPGWRVRGMAVLPKLRGRGVGLRLLEACVAHARERGGAYVWCNARDVALGFYARAGWRCVSEVFELSGIGPHRRMRLELRPS